MGYISIARERGSWGAAHGFLNVFHCNFLQVGPKVPLMGKMSVQGIIVWHFDFGSDIGWISLLSEAGVLLPLRMGFLSKQWIDMVDVFK